MALYKCLKDFKGAIGKRYREGDEVALREYAFMPIEEKMNFRKVVNDLPLIGSHDGAVDNAALAATKTIA